MGEQREHRPARPAFRYLAAGVLPVKRRFDANWRAVWRIGQTPTLAQGNGKEVVAIWPTPEYIGRAIADICSVFTAVARGVRGARSCPAGYEPPAAESKHRARAEAAGSATRSRSRPRLQSP